jgi:lipopolysaccharide transport system ATP-binding protein
MEEFWALEDVSLDVQPGEVVGIIGRNGAGKSTLLKILSRIVEPTKGEIRLRGRVASLLEVGTGFHPELSGRENIYLNGSILGMKKREIDRKFDEIVDFAEVDKFLETPVKRYSSGMYVRLAFAVAAHLDPEILIVDEVLAVGDAEFQKKCLGKMKEVSVGTGRTVLFVSHNLAAVQGLCDRAIYLSGGKVNFEGDSAAVISKYLSQRSSQITRVSLRDRTDRSGNKLIQLTSVRITDSTGVPVDTVSSGQTLTLVAEYQCAAPNRVRSVDVGISSQNQHDQLLFVLYSSYTDANFGTIATSGEFEVTIPRFPLAAGKYVIGARVCVNGEEADWPRDGVCELTVVPGDFYGTGRSGFDGVAPFLVAGTWKHRTKLCS